MCNGNNVITMRSQGEESHCHKITESIFMNRKKTQPTHRKQKTRRGELEYRRSRKTMGGSHRRKQREMAGERAVKSAVNQSYGILCKFNFNIMEKS